MDNPVPSTTMKSKLPAPASNLPIPGGGLKDVTEMFTNTKLPAPGFTAGSKPAGSTKFPTTKTTTSAGLMPKAATGTIRPVPAERISLVDRAGATKSNLQRPQIRGTGTVKGTSLVGGRITSGTSSTSSRSSRITTTSGSTRNTSNSSSNYGQSVGHARAQSTYGRSQTSMGQSVRPGAAVKRPATSMADREDGEGKRQGIPKYSSATFASRDYVGSRDYGSSLTIRKQRSPSKALDMGMFAPPRKPSREVSISTQINGLNLGTSLYRSPSESSDVGKSKASSNMGPPAPVVRSRGNTSSTTSFDDKTAKLPVCPKTPSKIPVAVPDPFVTGATPAPETPSRHPKSVLSGSTADVSLPAFLTKESNIKGFQAWDVDARMDEMESMYKKLQGTIESSNLASQGQEEMINHYKIRCLELESKSSSLETRCAALDSRVAILDQQVVSQQAEIDGSRHRLSSVQAAADDDLRNTRRKFDDAMHDHHREVNQLKNGMREEVERMKRAYQRDAVDEMERLKQRHRSDIEELQRQARQLLEEEERKKAQEVQEVKAQLAAQEQDLDAAVGNKDQEIQNLIRRLENVTLELTREKDVRASVQNALTTSSSTVVTLESKVLSLQDRIQFLESGSEAQSDRFALMEQQLHDALEATRESKAKLIHEETLRRILFNQVQELKGNIRVMCRVRPPTRDEKIATLEYPDLDKESKELELVGPEEKSSLGTISRKTNAFSFDRVFGPSNMNEDVFAEISQMVQSALDGYNVCIFAYGQTGAGKTHTMSSADGMIPRATHMIYEKAESLREKGWEYTMEGSFVEVYNEEIHDLLGAPRDMDKTKHEIRHDEKRKTTTVTNLKTVELDSANAVNGILERADKNRSVAATKSNERSSRSHSVFILKLVGKNSTTGDISEGTLNLVDLAGSERLKQSGAEGDRMKETQNINKSLSCLGDVIGALGTGKEGAHIPYRNSKLTYLLQYSLGGNSKTLMFVMVSPLEAHLKETLTSLKFATKVHNTHIGTAKKSKRISD